LEVAKYVDVLVYEGTTTKQLSDFFCGKFSLFGNKSFGKSLEKGTFCNKFSVFIANKRNLKKK
jgi:hypothetical protein